MTKKILASPEVNFSMEFVAYIVDKVQLYSVLNSVPQHDAVYISGFRVTCILVFDTR